MEMRFFLLQFVHQRFDVSTIARRLNVKAVFRFNHIRDVTLEVSVFDIIDQIRRVEELRGNDARVSDFAQEFRLSLGNEFDRRSSTNERTLLQQDL